MNERDRDYYRELDRRMEFNRQMDIRYDNFRQDQEYERAKIKRDHEEAFETIRRGQTAWAASKLGMHDVAIDIARGSFKRTSAVDEPPSYAKQALSEARRKLDSGDFPGAIEKYTAHILRADVAWRDGNRRCGRTVARNKTAGATAETNLAFPGRRLL